MKKRNSIDWPLLARYFSGDISEHDQRVVNSWIESDPINRKYIDALRTIWEQSERKSTPWDIESAWIKLAQQANIPISKKPMPSMQSLSRANRSNFFMPAFLLYKSRFIVMGAAALCLILFAVFWHWPSTSTHQQSATREISTEKGQQTKIELTDGTIIRLNAASVISFPEKFTQGVRECTLHGEAYFEVTHNDRMPFIVHMDGATIEVLGTEFNVRAWPEDKQINVVVADGKVIFRSDRGPDSQQVFLTRGQMSHLSAEGTVTPPELIDISKQLAWINGGIAFENAPMRDVIKNLERRYNLTFSISDSSILSHRLTTSFKKEDPVNKILNIIAISSDLRYKHTNDTVKLFRHSGTK